MTETSEILMRTSYAAFCSENDNWQQQYFILLLINIDIHWVYFDENLS